MGRCYRELLEFAQCDGGETLTVLCGGPMVGQAISTGDVPVIKRTSAILCCTQEEIKEEM